MAKDTPKSYNNLVLYEVYVRNHGPNGTFADVEAARAALEKTYQDAGFVTVFVDLGTSAVHALGYRFAAAGVMDMFPQTSHVECVVLMSRIQA